MSDITHEHLDAMRREINKNIQDSERRVADLLTNHADTDRAEFERGRQYMAEQTKSINGLALSVKEFDTGIAVVKYILAPSTVVAAVSAVFHLARHWNG